MLQRHAVKVEKARKGYGRGGEDAQPACRLLSEHGAEAEVDANGKPHGGDGAHELPRRQAEKDRLLVLPHFFRYLDFQIIISYCNNGESML